MRNFQNTYFEEHQRTATSDISKILMFISLAIKSFKYFFFHKSNSIFSLFCEAKGFIVKDESNKELVFQPYSETDTVADL